MRHPRWPSIGLNSCSASQRASTSRCGQALGALRPGVEVPHEPFHLLVVVRQELVQRRVEEADDDRVPLHDLEELVEVGLLHRQQACEVAPALLHRAGDDHLAEDVDAAVGEEHVLGAHQPDAARPEAAREGRVARSVGVRAHVEVPDEPVDDLEEVEHARLLGIGLDELRLAEVHRRGAVEGHVQGDVVAFLDGPVADDGLVPLDPHVGLHEGDLAVLPGDDRGVRRVAALGGQHARGDLDGLDVLGERGGQAEDELGVPALLLGGLELLEQPVGAEEDPADGRARGADDAARQAGHARDRGRGRRSGAAPRSAGRASPAARPTPSPRASARAGRAAS